MQYLKADTATTIRIGPFVDDTDGKTAETGLTIAQADVRLSKGGAAAAQKNDSTSATHDEAGYYRVPLNTTDTNTEGTLDVCVSEAGALPVIAKFTVLPAEVYDSIVAGTDKLQTDIVQVTGSSVTNVNDFKADLTSLNDPTAAAVATAVRSELTTELGRIDADITSRAVAGDAMTLTSGERSAVGTAVWDKNISTYANAGEAGTLLKIAEANTDDLKTTTIVKADIVSISGDQTAANNLESYCDGTTPIPSNVTQISGDSTAADNPRELLRRDRRHPGQHDRGRRVERFRRGGLQSRRVWPSDLIADRRCGLGTRPSLANTTAGHVRASTWTLPCPASRRAEYQLRTSPMPSGTRPSAGTRLPGPPARLWQTWKRTLRPFSPTRARRCRPRSTP